MDEDGLASATISDVESLQRRLGLVFRDPGLAIEALTHRSYAYENDALPHNERLEFLGDAVLGLLVTDMIFERFPELPEGEMAKLRASAVNAGVLAEVARKIGLGDHLLLGKGEDASGGRNKSSILADALEALLGAVYLDGGLEAARAFTLHHFEHLIREHAASDQVRDFKTTFQEEVARRTGTLPEYSITSSGPDHDKDFFARVYVGGRELGAGRGKSKKEAEQSAARQALVQIETAD